MIRVLIGLMAMLLLSCQPETSAEYIREIDEYYAKRYERLQSETGWLNLVGLYWLHEGDNTFGSDSSNQIVMPDKAPPFGGILTLKNDRVTVTSHKDASIFHRGTPVRKMELVTDADSNTTVLDMGTLRWFIIRRGSQFGVRLRDLESDRVASFQGIDRFPTDVRWRLTARWEPYVPARVIPVPTVLGTLDSMECHGALAFEIDGETYRLDAMGGKNERLFLIFGDQTNNRETYGAGRYLYVDWPDSAGHILLDFNKAYNPPCVFTDFATCPFPPPQNKLPIAIFAGEKKYGKH